MRNKSKTACLVLLLAFAACKKNEVPAPPAAPALPASPAPHPAAITHAPAPAPMDLGAVKLLLTEDKLSRFATYQKEMLSATSDAVGVGLQAYNKAGTDQKKFQGAMAADDRSAKINATNEAALKKSGLTQDEVSKLTRVFTPYYARAFAMHGAATKVEELRKKMEDAQAQGKQPNVVDVAMEKAFSAQVAQLETARKNFAAEWGEPALDLAQKHEPEFFAINEKMMGAAMGGLMKKK